MIIDKLKEDLNENTNYKLEYPDTLDSNLYWVVPKDNDDGLYDNLGFSVTFDKDRTKIVYTSLSLDSEVGEGPSIDTYKADELGKLIKVLMVVQKYMNQCIGGAWTMEFHSIYPRENFAAINHAIKDYDKFNSQTGKKDFF